MFIEIKVMWMRRPWTTKTAWMGLINENNFSRNNNVIKERGWNAYFLLHAVQMKKKKTFNVIISLLTVDLRVIKLYIIAQISKKREETFFPTVFDCSDLITSCQSRNIYNLILNNFNNITTFIYLVVVNLFSGLSI